jgi:hypothetical protein
MEKFSIWISLGIALALVIALIAFAKLHPLPQTRTVRDVNSLMVIAPYKY